MRRYVIVILLFANICYGVESYRFLVYRYKIPSLSTVETSLKTYGKTDISGAGGQPFRITSYLIAPNTNYAVINITLNNLSDNNYIRLMETNNYVLFLSSLDVIGTYDNRTGGWLNLPYHYIKNGLPADFYKVFKSS